MTDDRLLDALYALSPAAFEQHVAKLLEAEGYTEVRRIGGPDDRGVDIICRDHDGALVAVQCKRYQAASKINAMAIQHFSAMALRQHALRGIFVTTARYTQAARNQASDFDIELLDGQVLAALFNRHRALRDQIMSRQRDAAGSNRGERDTIEPPVPRRWDRELSPYGVSASTRGVPAATTAGTGSSQARHEFVAPPLLNDAEQQVLRALLNLHPDQFARLVIARYWRETRETDVVRIGQHGEFGTDIVVRHLADRPTPWCWENVTVLRCERYGRDRLVTEADLRAFLALLDQYGAYAGSFVTTSEFAADAYRFNGARRAHPQVSLVPGLTLLKEMQLPAGFDEATRDAKRRTKGVGWRKSFRPGMYADWVASSKKYNPVEWKERKSRPFLRRLFDPTV